MTKVVICVIIVLAVAILLDVLIVRANYGMDRKTDDEEQMKAIREIMEKKKEKKDAKESEK